MPFNRGFPATSDRGARGPQIFAYGKRLYLYPVVHNATWMQVWCGPKMAQKVSFPTRMCLMGF